MRQFLATLLLLTTSVCASAATPSAAGVHDALNSFVDKNDLATRYQLDRLADNTIEATVWFDGDYNFNAEEIEAYSDGICYSLMSQAVRTGLGQSDKPLSVVCHARITDPSHPESAGAPLGTSENDAKTGLFKFSPADNDLLAQKAKS
ncbi:hypothetical protein [Larsenimonas suaedae]|uniref:Uncharacterized protein n=1 Tax=Larsenimonas suaedae TaxID=1851019 RepID=A0ABU1GTD7_9GAMM|nr:hypothetical protein [Larsenimonas suaedae]MCM2971738.1 hypothetical protein [Larsenimonas suaedae]MDR5895290.1 hypothetical protein [Larsenimonas suaedae]